jgi:glycosyltransferase involved in cell wall biosynthesis
MLSIAVIVSTYNQPEHLDRCLLALQRQSQADFELILADDGSDERTRRISDKHSPGFRKPITHLWQEDQGFRKTQILNQAILASSAQYLVFMDGDCVAHPDFISEHAMKARRGVYLNGSMIRLGEQLTARIDGNSIESGCAFNSKWLTRQGGAWNRRYLRFSLGYRTRCWLDRHSRTKLYWLGANSSCFREDAVAVNGFDNRFTYGFEDGDFGNRLENYGLVPMTVRWTANVLHLFHGRPWDQPGVQERNRAMMTAKERGGRFWAEDGLDRFID